MKIKEFFQGSRVRTISGKIYRLSAMASLSVVLFILIPSAAVLFYYLLKAVGFDDQFVMITAIFTGVVLLGTVLTLIFNQILFGIQIKPFRTLFSKITDNSENSMDLDMSANRDFAKLIDSPDELGDIARNYYSMRKQSDDMINAMVKTNAELTEANIKAEEANAAKSEFLAKMSHEIRTPLNAILGMAEMLLRQPLDEKSRQYTSIINSSGDALLSLVDDILDFSGINSMKNDRLTEKKTAFIAGFKAPGSRVMVVDDNEVNLQVIDCLLDEFKVMTELVTSGEACLEMLKNDPYFDIIFMDHMMPQMDGIECFKAIRAMDGEFYKSVPVVMLSANVVCDIQKTFIDEGFSGFLAKPLQMAELEDVLLQLLPKEEILDNDSREAKMLDEALSDKKDICCDIKGINTEQGIMMVGGSQNVYISILRTYLREGREKLQMIREFAKNSDLENYTVYVHALKSASRNIGANELGEYAALHETKSKDKDIDFVLSDYENLLLEYGRILDSVEEYINGKI